MSFNTTGVAILEKLVDAALCKKLADELETIHNAGFTFKDDMCPASESIYRAANIEKLALDLLPVVEKATGLQLLPTYSFSRIYRPGEVLKPHIDRAACEISLTINLQQEGENWPIYMADKTFDDPNATTLVVESNTISVTNIKECYLNVGDAVLYKGCEKIHWRLPYKGIKQIQAFVHYVDANGPNKHYKDDSKTVPNTIADIKLLSQISFERKTDIVIKEILKACETKALQGAKFSIFEIPPFISITRLVGSLANTDLEITSSDIPNTIIVSWH
jgi:hypothetical protein